MLPETVFIIHNIQYSGKLYKKSNVVGCDEHYFRVTLLSTKVSLKRGLSYIFIQIQIVSIVLTLGNNILVQEPDSVVERLEILLRYDVVGVEVEDVVEEVPELVLLEG